MSEVTLQPGAGIAERPRFSATAIEDLLLGSRRVRQAFLQTPLRYAGRDGPLLRAGAGAAEPAAVQIRNGFAYHSCLLHDGRRAMLRILVPGDFAGLDSIVLARTTEDIYTVNRAGYHLLEAASLRELIADRSVLMFVLAQLAEQRWRSDRLAASIGRLDAHGRLCVLLLDIHDGCGTEG